MKSVFIFVITFFCAANLFAQPSGIAVNANGAPPDPSAVIDASSTSQGMLIPRLTEAQRDAISNPALALQIYNTSSNCFEFYANGSWHIIACACDSPVSPSEETHTAASSQIEWNWGSVSGATSYYYNTSNNFNTAISNGSGTTYVQSGLACETPSVLYVWAANDCGHSSATLLSETTGACCSEGSGGIITYSGGQTIHTFTASGTFMPGCAGSVEVLVIAGGGGGGSGGGGGGGAGGFVYDPTYAVSVQNYSVTVGAGGSGATVYDSGVNGGASVFGSISAVGGGGGAGSTLANGASGGSGGGGAQGSSTAGGTGESGQGSNGGNGTNYGFPYAAAGGGGAGGAGESTQSTSVAGSGGAGLSSSISGTPVFYAGGGGGAVWDGGGTAGSGGNGGGGAGCVGPGCGGTPATANTGGGGGGGGGYGSGSGGAGGSGIVIVSYPTP